MHLESGKEMKPVETTNHLWLHLKRLIWSAETKTPHMLTTMQSHVNSLRGHEEGMENGRENHLLTYCCLGFQVPMIDYYWIVSTLPRVTIQARLEAPTT